jgi:hypothetical protein
LNLPEGFAKGNLQTAGLGYGFLTALDTPITCLPMLATTITTMNAKRTPKVSQSSLRGMGWVNSERGIKKTGATPKSKPPLDKPDISRREQVKQLQWVAMDLADAGGMCQIFFNKRAGGLIKKRIEQ